MADRCLACRAARCGSSHARTRSFPTRAARRVFARSWLAALPSGLGVDDGGAALWAWTFAFLAPHLDLIFRVANLLWDLKALDGDEIDALMLAL
jgi:hypothetical protein